MSQPYAKAKGVAVKIRNPETGEDVLTKAADKHTGNEMELNSSSLPRAPVPKTNPERHGNGSRSKSHSQAPEGKVAVPLPPRPPPSQIPQSLPSAQPRPVSQLSAHQRSGHTPGPPPGSSSASPNPPLTTDWVPDVYARPHIPLWLQQINESNGQQKFARSLPTLNFGDYISTFAGKAFMPPAANVLPAAAQPDRLSLSLTTRNLTATNFYAYFEECLIAERQSHVQDLKLFNCYRVPLIAYDPSNCMFGVHVPGLREDAPCVVLNDIVLIRQLVGGLENEIAHAMHAWARDGGGKGNGQVAPGFTGFVHHAVVHGINKALERIFLHIDYAMPGLPCNIEFIAQSHHYLPILRSVTNVSNRLLISEARVKSRQPGGSFDQGAIDHLWEEMESARDCQWLRRMLFPEQADAITQTVLAQGVYDLNWVDTMLNYEQKKAVGSIVSRNYGILPYLISGPPGTGKTKTIVESTMQLLNLYKTNGPHILVCAPSDPAADTLALRLSPHLNPQELFRLNAPQRTFAEVPDRLMPYCYTESDLFTLPQFKQLMKYKVVVTTCRGADILVQARVTNRDLISLGKDMTSVLTGGHLPHHDFMHWKALLIDEAAQATEPEACIPLTVVDVDVSMPDNPSDTLHTPLFVMAGDSYQLGPRVYNRDTALSISLFERLFSRPLYMEHPASRRNMNRSAPPSAVQPTYPAFTNLIRSYRSHPAILSIPSSLFYNDTLIPEAPRSDTLATLPIWSGRRWPVLFSCNTGPDDIEQDAGGWFNKSEALLALSHAKTILSHSTLTPSEICIMSPFGTQVSRLRNLFRANGLRDVNIGPLEAFQGLESPVVILCATRTRARFLAEDRQRGLGIMFEAKRFNVSITRAKLGLFIIGNPDLLASDPTWRVLLEFCWRNELWDDREGVSEWRPAEDVVEGMPSRVSSMEAALVFEERDKDVQGESGGARFLRGGRDEEEGMWAAGLAAENVLWGAEGGVWGGVV